MGQDEFIARCRAQLVQAREGAAAGHYQALARDMAGLKELGISLTLVESYAVGPYRYTNLADAIAQAQRACSSGDRPKRP
jgi:hypothetical protein